MLGAPADARGAEGAEGPHDPHGSDGEPPPNILLVVADDLGWTDWQRSPDLNPHGSPVYETPHLEALARRGVVFDQATSAAPVCSPSRAALLTGRAPASLHLTDFVVGSDHRSERLLQPEWTNRLSPDETTLADALAGAGYDTAFFGKWHLGPSGEPSADPLEFGFAANVGGNRLGNPFLAGGFFAGADGAWRFLPGLDEPGSHAPDAYLTDVLAERAERFVATSARSGRPFFAMVSLYAVHPIYEAPKALVEKYRRKIEALSRDGERPVSHGHPVYAAMVEKLDDAVGRLLARLDDPDGDGDVGDGIRDRTIVLFTSDNGGLLAAPEPATSNAPLRSGKGSLYEGGIRVPFILSWTGHPALPDAGGRQGRRTRARVISHDVLPTLLDLAGVTPSPATSGRGAVEGVSLRAAVEGGEPDRGDLFWHYPHRSPQSASDASFEGGSFVSALRRDRWKLLYSWETRSAELYDLESDPGETRDLAGERPDLTAELTAALGRWLAKTGAQPPLDATSGEPVPLPGAPDPARSGPVPLFAWIGLGLLCAGSIAAGVARRRREREAR